jgi:8-oxo-dGTP diphosphatase
MPKSPPRQETRHRPRAKRSVAGVTALARVDDEAAFLASYDPSKFERPSVAVDVVLLTVDEGGLVTLLLPRTEHPFKGAFALPGGFVHLDESLEDAASRVLETKAGLSGAFLEQLYTFGSPGRDPRTRVISVTYYALVSRAHLAAVRAVPGAAPVWGRVDVPWESETGGPVLVRENATDRSMVLAFDHAHILGMAVKRIRGKLDYSPIGFQLLPERFTLLDLQRVHEVVLDRPLNKDSFRRRMLTSGQLEATGEHQQGAGRPAELYRFVRRSAV